MASSVTADRKQMVEEPGRSVRSGAAPPACVSDRLPLPDKVVRGKVRWHYAGAVAVLHLLALPAVIPWMFSWTGLAAMLVGVHVFGQSINLCYHRILSHRCARVPK